MVSYVKFQSINCGKIKQMKVKFTYNEPRFGDMEIVTDGASPTWTDEEIINEIEAAFPEAIDIEVLEITNG